MMLTMPRKAAAKVVLIFIETSAEGSGSGMVSLAARKKCCDDERE